MDLADGATTLPTIDYYPPEIAQLCAVAAREITEHENVRGLCVICGSVWPCGRAVLAEHNLAVI
ncbi:conserved hypothetical protein [Frankia canadensis]|uniref:Uncharacterized protein n=1 Tax=Frankia canadensis TaxID=1836972 RepID=A0A2I2KPC2_9ACTN|nr:hypothetical protein [Frankia canadensis]SNQ47517.1 conserved hypothetical protein [Frankia canadensis]SOU54807.1 conserved hypothetical protein [Frankia canadensis]